MIRRISTKWVLTVLAAVVVPFVGFAYFVNTRISDRVSGDVVRYTLLSMAADMADRINSEIDERRLDAELLAVANPVLEWYMTGDERDESEVFLQYVQTAFDGLVRKTHAYDLVLAIDTTGRIAAANQVDARGREIEELAEQGDIDFAGEGWFQEAMGEGFAMIDCYGPGLLPTAEALAVRPTQGPANPTDYHIGFACRIEPSPGVVGPVGVVLLVVNWSLFQDQVSRVGVRRIQRVRGDPIGEDIYESSYAWIWKSDADTIIAHPRRELYGQKVSTDVGLPQLVEAASNAPAGMYPEYSFGGVGKQAAFNHCKSRGEGGFGWVVGVGANNADIYAPVAELSRLLYAATAVVLLVVVLWTMIVARRTTQPILDLQQHTRRIASGDLDARIVVDRADELGDLAIAFNRMTAELKENRDQLVRAEKDAAWREMARQVAHEIKNPLTPISLSASLLKRSRDEGSEEFDVIFDRTIELIQRQVGNMREIARDFYAFAGEHREPATVDLGQLVDEVLELNAAWAESQSVTVRREGGGGNVRADPEELRRALINLVSNALEAMPDGGELLARVSATDEEVSVEVGDTGDGLSPEVERRLFEPYFTTRSSGTGLGLAIVRRVVEDMGGRVELKNSTTGRGAVARIALPRQP